MFLIFFAILVRSGVDLRGKSALLEVFVHSIFFFTDHFFKLVLLPNSNSFKECGAACSKIALVVLQYRLESAFDIDTVLAISVTLQQIFLRLQALTVQVFPYRLRHLFGLNVLKGRAMEAPHISLITGRGRRMSVGVVAGWRWGVGVRMLRRGA